MEPKQNDVLSGRGACFNQHPGNKRFRMILDEHRDAYIKGTKKQKMMISHFIVEAVYSSQPAGRFLKKSDDDAHWRELSEKEASNKAAQAMAYAVRNESKQKPSTYSLSAGDQPVTLQANIPTVIGNSSLAAHASASSRQWAEGATTAADDGNDEDANAGGCNALSHDNSSLQQEPTQIQYPTYNLFPSNSGSGANLNGNGSAPLTRTQLLSQEQIQQQYQLFQQQLHHQYLLMGHHPLQPQTQLPFTSLPPTQSSSAPGAILPNMAILRQEYCPRGNYGTQPSNFSQNLWNVQPKPNVSHSVMDNYQSNFGTASAPQQETQILDQVQRVLMLQNHLLSSASSSLNAANCQTQLQPLDLLQQIALLQQNSQYPPPNNSELELSGDDIAHPSTREEQGHGQVQGGGWAEGISLGYYNYYCSSFHTPPSGGEKAEEYLITLPPSKHLHTLTK